jgi:hypothetical protein
VGSLTRPFRDARRFPSTRLYPVPRATRTPRKCGRCPSFKDHSLSPRVPNPNRPIRSFHVTVCPWGQVYVVGEIGIQEELDLVGVPHIGGPADGDKKIDLSPGNFMEHDKDVGAVVVGFDRYFNYYKIQYAPQRRQPPPPRDRVIERWRRRLCLR